MGNSVSKGKNQNVTKKKLPTEAGPSKSKNPGKPNVDSMKGPEQVSSPATLVPTAQGNLASQVAQQPNREIQASEPQPINSSSTAVDHIAHEKGTGGGPIANVAKSTAFSPPPPGGWSRPEDAGLKIESADVTGEATSSHVPPGGRRNSPPPENVPGVESSSFNSSSPIESKLGAAGDFSDSALVGSAPEVKLDSETLSKLEENISNLVKSPSQNIATEVDIDGAIGRLLDMRNGKSGKTFCLKNNEIIYICYKAREILLEQSCLLELNPPVNIVGDIHGQYDDLLRIFDILGYPPSTNYLFLGDYVDRGKQSLETILLLLCFKIKYPENFFILRGNHECASVNRVYGFYDECKRRCSLKIWKVFTDVFNCLPIAAVVAGKIFCVHGGLSPSLNNMNDIRTIQRPTDVPDFGLLNDLLWSDPSETAVDWEDNERGVSYCFGKSILADFLAKHEFDLVARAHIVVEDGYEFFGDRTLVTVFSAPNYCGEFDNKGAVMAVNDDLLCSFELLQPQTSAKYQVKKRRASPPTIK